MSNYSVHASRYLQLGFQPVPVVGKRIVASGLSGRDQQRIESKEDIQAVAAQAPSYAQTAVVLPRGVIGIDVDTRHGKTGAETLRELWKKLGVLPPTLRTSSLKNRSEGDPNSHGIYLYRVDDDYEAISGLPGVDTIQWFHRYVLVYPSRHPETEEQYEWSYTAPNDGFWRPVNHQVNTLLDLVADLPKTWAEYLRTKTTAARKNVRADPFAQYRKVATSGEICPTVREILDDFTKQIQDQGYSRHDSARDIQYRLFCAGSEGHTGVDAAVDELRELFDSATIDEGERDTDGEWDRMLDGALRYDWDEAESPCSCQKLYDRILRKKAEDEHVQETTAEESVQASAGPEEDTADASGYLEGPEEPEESEEPEDVLTRYELDTQSWTFQKMVRDQLQSRLARREVDKLMREYLVGKQNENGRSLGELLVDMDEEEEDDEDGAARGWLFIDEEDPWVETGLLYKGLINGIFGEGSTGKSLLVTKIWDTVLPAGSMGCSLNGRAPMRWNIVHFDLDNNSDALIARRIKAVTQGPSRGVAKFVGLERLRILRSVSEIEDLEPEFIEQVGLVTLDALNPAIASLGLDPNEVHAVDSVFQQFFGPFTHATKVFIDHVGHGDKSRQMNSIRKQQAVQGALWRLERDNEGTPWTGRLKLVKDNVGVLTTQGLTDLGVSFTSKGSKLDVRVTRGVGHDPSVIQQKSKPSQHSPRRKKAFEITAAKPLTPREIWEAFQGTEGAFPDVNTVRVWVRNFQKRDDVRTIRLGTGSTVDPYRYQFMDPDNVAVNTDEDD